MTAMTSERMTNAKMNDKDRFTMTELAALRNDLLQGGMIDSYEAAELLQVFLMGRGYGVSPKAALDAAGRVEMAGCAMPVLVARTGKPGNGDVTVPAARAGDPAAHANMRFGLRGCVRRREAVGWKARKSHRVPGFRHPGSPIETRPNEPVPQ